MKIDETKIQNNSLKGLLSVRLKNGKTFEKFCERNFPGFNSMKLDPLAVRLYYGREKIVTLYAVDKSKVKHNGGNITIHKVPVKKFKSDTILLNELLSFMDELNFTLCNGHFPVEQMKVINK